MISFLNASGNKEPQMHYLKCVHNKEDMRKLQTQDKTAQTYLSKKWKTKNWVGKTLTESKKIESSTGVVLRRVGVHSMNCAHLIGKTKISKLRGLMEPSISINTMTSDKLQRKETGLKNSNECENVFPIFSTKNNVES